MDTALCISGQARNLSPSFDGLGRHPSFVAIWRRRGRKVDGALDEPSFRRMFPADVVNSFIYDLQGQAVYQELPFLRSVLEADMLASNIVTEAELETVFQPATVLIRDEEPIDALLQAGHSSVARNSLKMLDGIDAANCLKIAAEAQRGTRFDIVVRLRPDLVVHGLPPLESLPLTPDRLYLDWVDPISRGCGDKLAIGTSGALDRFASFHETYRRAVVTGDNPTLLNRSIHEVLFEHNERVGLDMRDLRQLGLKSELSVHLVATDAVALAAQEAGKVGSIAVRLRTQLFILQLNSYTALERGDWRLAVKLADEAAALDPAALGPLRARFVALAETHDHNARLDAAARVLERFGTFGRMDAGGTAKLTLLREVEAYLGNAGLAGQTVVTGRIERRIRQVEEEYAHLRFAQAAVMIHQGLIDEAKPMLTAALRMDPAEVQHYHHAADMLMNAGQMDLACEVLRSGLPHVPRPEYLYQALIRILRHPARLEARLEALQAVIEIAANPVHYLGELAGCHADMGNFARASLTLERALAIDPTQPWLWRLRARILADTGRPADAIKDLIKSESLGGTDGHVFATLGTLYDELSLNKEALTAFERHATSVTAGAWVINRIQELRAINSTLSEKDTPT